MHVGRETEMMEGWGWGSFRLKTEQFSCFLPPRLLLRQRGLRSQEEEEVEVGGRSLGGLFKTPFKVDGANVSTTQGTMDVLLKEPSVCLEDFCCLLVQRVLRVRLLWGVRGQGSGVSHTGVESRRS